MCEWLTCHVEWLFVATKRATLRSGWLVLCHNLPHSIGQATNIDAILGIVSTVNGLSAEGSIVSAIISGGTSTTGW